MSPRQTRRSLVRLIKIPATLLLIGVSHALLAGESDRVLVVENANSPMSVDIGNDYALRRGIKHIVHVRCQDASVAGEVIPSPDPQAGGILETKAETISLPLYREEIETPIKAYLRAHAGIDFIVLTKGIPIRISEAGEPDGLDRFSLDGHLASLDYETLTGAAPVQISEPGSDEYYQKWFGRHYRATAWANRFWNSQERFTHARFGGYLVTRLDGYTANDAKALVRRALQAESGAKSGKMPSGAVLLDVAPRYGFTSQARQPYSILAERANVDDPVRIVDEPSHLRDFNSDIQLAAGILRGRGIRTELDLSPKFIGNRSGLLGYVSWGSNDPDFTLAAYHTISFVAGALAETAVSTSGRTFLRTSGGQSLAADLIAQGVTGTKAYVDEPLVQAVASPSIVFDRYSRGWTLAESFYAASALLGWEDLVIGDPLARAFPARTDPRR